MRKIGFGELKNLANKLAASGGVEAVADALINDSFWHPNGFLKMVVSKLPDGSRFRVHYWPSKSERRLDAEEEIHSHRWNFWSLILEGSLKIETFAIATAQDKTHTKVLCSPNSNGTYSFSANGGVGLTLLSRNIASSGTAHFGTTSTIHRTTPANEQLVVTAFMQSPPLLGTSSVLREGNSNGILSAKSARPIRLDVMKALEVALSKRGIIYD